jgi:hypothetical protein
VVLLNEPYILDFLVGDSLEVLWLDTAETELLANVSLEASDTDIARVEHVHALSQNAALH